jgi:transposase
MPRFKPVDHGLQFLAVDLSLQLHPGSFEYALHHLIEHEIDLTEIEARYKNEEEGAVAYDPRVLLKIVLLSYSRGIVGSRGMQAACCRDVQFMAISGNSAPCFGTLAHFVSSLGEVIGKLFAQVLTICDRQGLIGRQMFAIDGVKLPSNAAKAKSGKRKDFIRQVDKMEKAVEQILAKQRAADAAASEVVLEAKAKRRLERLQAEAAKLREWLKAHPQDRTGPKGKPRLSNLTDNESAKMATDKGVIQGYTGVAAVDEKHQIIVEAQAHGSGSEQELLVPVSQAIQPLAKPDTVICADSGYCSEDNLKQLEAKGIAAFIPDNAYRKRDPRYQGQAQHSAKPDALWDKSNKPPKKPKVFQPAEFKMAKDRSHCICPAGKRLYRSGNNCNIGGRRAIKFKGTQRDCEKCPLRAQCLRHPQRSLVRQVAILLGRHEKAAEKASERMKRKIDTEQGREMMARRFATVEPVFGNLRANKGLNRFTLRGRTKVDGQWKLYCLVHNIEKLANNGYAKQEATAR